MAQILIVVGSVYGNANESAIACQQVFSEQGHQVRLVESATLDDLKPYGSQILVVCTSTTGMGDVPDNLMSFYCQLLDDSPNLDALSYGVLGLGDSSYDLFNGAAKLIDQRLKTLGAKRLGEPLFIDACTDRVPENIAEYWARDWGCLLDKSTCS